MNTISKETQKIMCAVVAAVSNSPMKIGAHVEKAQRPPLANKLVAYRLRGQFEDLVVLANKFGGQPEYCGSYRGQQYDLDMFEVYIGNDIILYWIEDEAK